MVDEYQRILGDMMPDSSMWLFDTKEYSDWRCATSQVHLLWVTGIPGAGKTRMATRTVQRLKTEHAKVAYFYCNTQEEGTLVILNMLKTWAWQVLQQDSTRLDRFADVFYDIPNVTSMKETLKAVLDGHDRPFIVLDGLDECELETQSDIIEFLRSLAGRAKVIFFSREGNNIARSFTSVPQDYRLHYHMTQQANKSDIARYLKQSVTALNIEDETINQTITTTLHDGANGMLLWAALMVTELQKPKMLEEDYLDTLRDLPLDILEEAQYWLKSTTSQEEIRVVDKDTSHKQTPYIASEPIAGYLRHPVRQVVFNMQSHDQGWSSLPLLHGTRVASWTWFEVGVMKAGTEAYDFGDSHIDVQQQDRFITSNLHAVWEKSNYRIVFRCKPAATTAAVVDGQRYCRWIDALESGDTVQVFARAAFPG
ncbi:hypothetical protein MBLNU459_g4252t2 [Dothideomycetes sp. NU459]